MAAVSLRLQIGAGFGTEMHPMKKIISIFTLLLAVTGVRAALPQPDLIAQIHFAGVSKISAAANFSAFTNEFCSAEALALRKQTADKLSVWLAGWLQKITGVTVADGAAKLRPLFDDLQKSEWNLTARTDAGDKVDVRIAIQLSPARAQLWQAGLKIFFPAATFEQPKDWLVFDSGTGAMKSSDRVEEKLPSPNLWLSADINWPRLAQWYPDLKSLGLPETLFTVTAPDENLRINGRFFFPENLSLNLEPWRVPTNSLHQPFVSFTAVRGFAAWFAAQSWVQAYQMAPTPNQYFTWAMPQIPYQTFAAVPVANAADALTQAYARLQPLVKPQAGAPGMLLASAKLTLTNNEISLVGVPFISPFLRAVKEPAGQFLFAGAFPNTPRSKPLPTELFQRLAEPNLVFYHWEITAERVPSALNLSQLGMVLTSHRQLGGESASLKWILKTSPKLGNTVTEITQTAPDQMTFTRKSPGIFTAVEMLALGHWLEAPNFPGCDLRLPPRPALKKLHPHPSAALPAPAPSK